MQDTFAVSNKAIAYVMWAVVKILITAAWATWLFDERNPVSYMLGFTACIMTGVAVILHFRYYTLRVCNLIRASCGIDPGGAGCETESGLRSVP